MHNVTVAGDTRFDRVTDIMQGCRELPFLTEFSKDKKFIFMAGSSWPADEAIYFPWLKAHKEVKAVIAPHEFDDKRVADICAAFPGECVAWTELENDPKLIEGKRIVVMNCMGLLSSAYRYANVAYIGGGFGSGLHNINEAAVYGIPVIFGPNNAKFIEAQEIQQCSAGFEVHSAEELSSIATKLLNDAKYSSEAGTAAAKYIKSKLGATEIIYHDLFES
jgi:3-deoxy-D-manno-octulosonic-acid transferase